MSRKPDNEQAAADGSHSRTDAKNTEQNLQFIRLLNHYRHDWMNEIQVLFGYVKLKKYDKLESLMEKIRYKVQVESYIAKLGAPDLIVYLLAYQTEVKEITLSIVMEQEIHLDELPIDMHRIHGIIRAVMEAFKDNARQCVDGEHSLVLHLIREQERLVIDFMYAGQVKEAVFMQSLQKLRQTSEPLETWEVVRVKENQAAVTVALSLIT